MRRIHGEDMINLTKAFSVREYDAGKGVFMLEIILDKGATTFGRRFSKIIDDAGYRLFGMLLMSHHRAKLTFYHESDKEKINS